MIDLWDSNCKLLYRVFHTYCKKVICGNTVSKVDAHVRKLRRTIVSEMRQQDELYLGDGFEADLECFHIPNEKVELCQLGFSLYDRGLSMGRIYDIRANNMYMVIYTPRTSITLHRACNGKDFPDSEGPPPDIVVTTGFITATPEEERVKSLYDLLSYEERRDLRAAAELGSDRIPPPEPKPKPKRVYRTKARREESCREELE